MTVTCADNSSQETTTSHMRPSTTKQSEKIFPFKALQLEPTVHNHLQLETASSQHLRQLLAVSSMIVHTIFNYCLPQLNGSPKLVM